MVIDTSAVVALLRNEPEREALSRAIFRDERRLISAVSKLETSMVVLGRLGAGAMLRLDRLLAEIAATVVPFDDRQADIAREAFARYGKGRHRAGLNFGDCVSYALAIGEAEPLLFKGTDFAATDVDVAAY
jgi:ribonuclease VapC